MDREQIIRMAREAGLAYGSDEKPLGSVTRFAALVAAHELRRVLGYVRTSTPSTKVKMYWQLGAPPPYEQGGSSETHR